MLRWKKLKDKKIGSLGQVKDRKLSITEEENKRFKVNLQKAKEKSEQTEEEISSIHLNLCALEEKYDASTAAWWETLNTENERVVSR